MMDKELRYEKYIEKFLKEIKVGEKETYKNLFNKLEDVNKFITEWNNEDLDEFIKDTGSISVNTVNKYLQFTRDIYKFICNEENIEPKHLFLSYDLKEYIDLEKLMSVTLNEIQYKMLKELMTVPTPEGEKNYRDKVLVELAWEGLTNNELKHLKVSDIEIYDEYDKLKMRLKLKNRTVIITDEDIIYDVKKCINEKHYWLIQKNRQYEVAYKDTPNLIKPVAMRQSDKDEVANPSMLLNRVLRKIEDEGTHEILSTINLSELSLEDIRRSRIIHEFKDPVTDIDDICEMFGRANESDLYWLREVAQFIYKKEKEYKK